MSVTRYAVNFCLTEFDSGSWVRYSDYAELLARHNALREAVAWERECDGCGEWLHEAWWDDHKINLRDIWDIYQDSRAEVDRLLGEG